MSQKQRLEEQMLSQEAQRRISQELDGAEKIDIDVQTDLLKMIQGQADGVSFAGQGLVIKGIRVQDIKLQTDDVSINPFSALFGEIELNQPLNATARILLTEADVNRALMSNDIRNKMQSFAFGLNVDGRIVKLKLQEIQIVLPESGKIGFDGKVLVQDEGNSQSLCFTAMICPRTRHKPIMLENFNCTHGVGIALDIVVALMQKVKELVNLPYFQFEDMALRIKEMEVKQGSITLVVEAYVRQIAVQ